METHWNKHFEITKNNRYILLSFLISVVLALGTMSIFIFMPDFIFGKIIPKTSSFYHGTMSQFDCFNMWTFGSDIAWKKVCGGIWWASAAIITFLGVLVGWILIRQFISILTYENWYPKYLNCCTEIINSCDVSQFKYKVAMVVSTCNDILPSTIIQTANQTYKNMDVWISDDSNKPEMIAKIDAFAKEHGYHVLHRDSEHKKAHPTKLGNLFYFVSKHGDEYDYVFENDSSSIITSSFVENCLCFFNTPLLNHDKDGGIICNGGFYGTKALLPFVYSKAWQMGCGIGIVGGMVELTGKTALMDGWGAMYKVSTLKQIPIEKVECPSCDMARGLWLTNHGFINYQNPFDFAAKMCTQNMESIKNQFLKWHGAEVFLFRTGISMSNMHDKTTNYYIKSHMFNIVIVIPITAILLFIQVALIAAVNFVYFNFSAIVMLAAFWIVLIIIFVSLLFIKHVPILTFVCFILFFPLTFMAYVYRKIWQNIVRGFILKKWSSGAVTVKGVCKSTTKQKFRMCLLDFVIIALATTLCLILTFVVPEKNLSRLIIWLNIFLILALPSILYILLVWIGEIPVKKGWDPTQQIYPIEQFDFRYKYVKETEVWKKHHPKK